MERRKSTIQGSVVSYHNVNYEVAVRAQGKCCGTVPKKILRDIKLVLFDVDTLLYLAIGSCHLSFAH